MSEYGRNDEAFENQRQNDPIVLHQADFTVFSEISKFSKNVKTVNNRVEGLLLFSLNF